MITAPHDTQPLFDPVGTTVVVAEASSAFTGLLPPLKLQVGLSHEPL
jgi:hypothetical protein